MTTEAEDILNYNIRPYFYVEIDIPRCNNVFSQSPCTASGTPICYYNWASCRDKENYVIDSRVWRFQSNERVGNVFVAEDIHSLIDEVSDIALEIKPDQGITFRSRVEITFFDQVNPTFPDHDKGDPFHNTIVAGRFWSNFIQRYPNFAGQPIRIYKGTTEATSLADLRLIFEGNIIDLDYVEDGKVRLSATDILSDRGDQKIPNPIQTTNVTDDPLALDGGEVSFNLTDTSPIRVLEAPTILSFENVGRTIYADDPTEFEHKLVHDFSDVFTSLFFTMKGWAHNRDLDIFYLVYIEQGPSIIFASLNRQTRELIIIKEVMVNDPIDICYDNGAGIIYFSTGTELFSMDPVTGIETSIGSHGGTFNNIKGVCIFDEFGIGSAPLYAVNEDTGSTNNFVQLNKISGVASLIGDMGFATTIASAAIDLLNEKAYTIAVADGKIRKISIADGSSVEVVDIPSSTGDNLCMSKLRNDMVIQIQDRDNGDEFIRIDRIQDENTVDITRGRYGTATPAHATALKFKQVAVWLNENDTGIDSDVGLHIVDALLSVLHIWLRIPYSRINWDSFYNEKHSWLIKYIVRRILVNTTRADEILRKMREVGLILLWQNESQEMEIKTNHQINPSEEVTFINETSNMIEDQVPLVDLNLRGQISEAVVFYKPLDVFGLKSHTADDDFELVHIVSDTDVSNPNNFGKAFPEDFHNDFIFTEFVAKSSADQQVLWFATPKKIIDFIVSKKDIAIKTGDIVEIETESIVDNDGNISRRVFFVLKKQELRDGSIILRCLETPLIASNDTTSDRFAFVHETPVPVDFDVATEQELKWGYTNDDTELFQYLIG